MLNIKDLSRPELPKQDNYEQALKIALEILARKDPGRIVELYRRWAGYATGPTEPGVTLVYGSMYGNTEKMMNAVAQGISGEKVPLEIFDINHTHVSFILPALWTRSGVAIGAPTYEGGLFPPMVHLLDMAERKGIRNKQVARFGSYGWSGGAQREFEALIGKLGWKLVDSFEFVGAPTEEELRRGVEFGAALARAVKESP